MSKPIRCTTHFHACDCREYEFEQLRKELQEKDRAILSQEKDRQRTEAFWKEKLGEIQHQLEIQTKRVENLKNFLSQGDELKVLREWIFRSDSLSRCQAIDQELEKQLGNLK